MNYLLGLPQWRLQVLPDLSVDAAHLHMASVAVAMKEIGYDIHVSTATLPISCSMTPRTV